MRLPTAGEVLEWLIRPVSKTGRPERVSWVQIPPSPPLFFLPARHYRAATRMLLVSPIVRKTTLLAIGFSAAVQLTAGSPPRVVQVTLDSSPVALAVNPTSGQVLALEPSRITVIDEVTRSRSVISAYAYFGLTIDIVNDHAYSAGIGPNPLEGGLTEIDVASGQTSFINDSYIGLPTANSATHRVYMTRPHYLYHTTFPIHSVGVIDGETLEVHDIPVTAQSVALAVDERQNKIYVGTRGDLAGGPTPLTIIDGQTEDTTDIDLHCAPDLVAADPESGEGWAACSFPPGVFLVRPGLVQRYPLEAKPSLLTVIPSTGKAYVALEGQPFLVEIDPYLES